MARPCVYRHDVRCPDPNAAPIGCPKPALSKAAKSVYRCGDCQRCCTPDAAYHRPSAADRERALAMYQEGGSPRAVGWAGFSG